MTCRCRHYRKLFIAVPILFVISEALIYAVATSLLGAMLIGYWPVLALQVGLFMRSSHRKHGPPQSVASVRTPAFPAGHGCPAGCCPICGMPDPDRLVDGVHESCVEWLGYVPQRPVGGVSCVEVEAAAHLGVLAGMRSINQERLEIQREIRRYEQLVQAEYQAEERRRIRAIRQAECPHEESDSHSFCGKCGAQLRAPEPTATITLPTAWTPEQVEAFRVAWAAAAPDESPIKSKIVRIEHG